jgi:hypothetical protein
VGTRCVRAIINKERTIPVTHTDDFIWRLIEDCVPPGLVTNANIHIHMTATPALTVKGLRLSFTWDTYVIAECEYVLRRCKLE